MTYLGDARWINGLTKVVIYPECTNQHQKIAVLATLILGQSGSSMVSYQITFKQQKQTRVGCLGHPSALTAEKIKNTFLSGCNLSP